MTDEWDLSRLFWTAFQPADRVFHLSLFTFHLSHPEERELLLTVLRSPSAGPSLSPPGESDRCVRFQIIRPGSGPAFGPDPENLSHQYQSIATVFAPSLHRTP